MASEREFFFSSMWGFSDVAIQDVRRLIQAYDPDLQVKYLKAGAAFALKGDLDAYFLRKCAELIEYYIEKHQPSFLSNNSRLRPLLPLSRSKALTVGEPVFSELGIDDENAGLEGPMLMGWHPSNEDLGYFATDRLGVLPRVAAATDTVITIEHASDCYPGQLHIWGERLQNLDAALAKLMMLEKPMDTEENPYRAFVLMTEEARFRGYRMFRYGALGKRAVGRILLEPYDDVNIHMAHMYKPVVLDFCKTSKRWRLPECLEYPDGVFLAPRYAFLWETFFSEAPQIGDGEDYVHEAPTLTLCDLFKLHAFVPISGRDHPFLSPERTHELSVWSASVRDGTPEGPSPTRATFEGGSGSEGKPTPPRFVTPESDKSDEAASYEGLWSGKGQSVIPSPADIKSPSRKLSPYSLKIFGSVAPLAHRRRVSLAESAPKGKQAGPRSGVLIDFPDVEEPLSIEKGGASANVMAAHEVWVTPRYPVAPGLKTPPRQRLSLGQAAPAELGVHPAFRASAASDNSSSLDMPGSSASVGGNEGALTSIGALAISNPAQDDTELHASRPEILESFFQRLMPLLNVARSYPGSLTFEIQLGIGLIPHLPHSFNVELMKHFDEIQELFSPTTGLNPPSCIFFNRLTTSLADVEHIINVKFNGDRLFDPNYTTRRIEYEFQCETDTGDILVITVDDRGESRLGKKPKPLGAVYTLFPARVWDASAVIHGNMDRTLMLDPETQEAAERVISSLYVDPNETKARLLARVQGNKLEVIKILMKRTTMHRYYRELHPVRSSRDTYLRLTEVQDLAVAKWPGNLGVHEACCAPLEDMKRHNRHWWEASLVSPAVNALLKTNVHLQPGEMTSKWCAEGLFDRNAKLVRRTSASASNTSGPLNVGVIDPTGLYGLLGLAEKVVRGIDAVGFHNCGPVVDLPMVSLLGSSTTSQQQEDEKESSPETPTDDVAAGAVVKTVRSSASEGEENFW